MESPYRPGVGALPAVFAGRGREVQRAERMLATVANSGEAAPAPMVITGPRGVGKTVLLRVMREVADDRGFVTASVVFDSRDGNHRALAAAVADAVRLRDPDSGVWARVRDRLRGLSIEVNAGVVTVASGPDASARTPPAPTDRKHLGGLLVEAGQAASTLGRPGLAVFVDELHEAPIDDLRTISTAMQDLIQSVRTPVVVFMAGLPQTPDVLIEANSFAERFDYLALPRLGEDAALRVLLEPALDKGVRWAPTAAERVVALAAGNPFMLQKLGHEAWLLHARAAGDVIEVADVEVAQEATAAALGAGMFRGRWAKASPAEQALLAGMAAVASEEGVVVTADVVAATGRSTPQWSMARRSLIDKGLVETAGHGRLRFTMPTFADYVREITGIDHLGPGPQTQEHHTIAEASWRPEPLAGESASGKC